MGTAKTNVNAKADADASTSDNKENKPDKEDKPEDVTANDTHPENTVDENTNTNRQTAETAETEAEPPCWRIREAWLRGPRATLAALRQKKLMLKVGGSPIAFADAVGAKRKTSKKPRKFKEIRKSVGAAKLALASAASKEISEKAAANLKNLSGAEKMAEV